MNNKVVTYQWCVEVLQRQRREQKEIYASQLSFFEKKYDMLKAGKAELCLVRTETNEGEVVEMLWSYARRGVLQPYIDAMGKVVVVDIPERFGEELKRFANRERSHTVKRKEENVPNVDTGRRINFRKHHGEIKIAGVREGTVPVRVDRKTIVYLDAKMNVEEMDAVLNKYRRPQL